MDIGDYATWYAAIVATIVLLKDSIKFPKLSFKSEVDWGPNSGWSTPNQALIYLTTTNSGHNTITLTDVVPTGRDLKEGKLYKPEGLPKTLNKGEATIVIADIALAGEGWLYLEIEDSAGRRYRIPQEDHSLLQMKARRYIESMLSIREAAQER